jgi:hypothetical protein
MAVQPKRQPSSYSPLWEPQIIITFVSFSMRGERWELWIFYCVENIELHQKFNLYRLVL